MPGPMAPAMPAGGMDLAAILEMLKNGMAGNTQALVGDKTGLPPAPQAPGMPVNNYVRALGGSPPIQTTAGGGGHGMVAPPEPGLSVGGPPPAAAAPPRAPMPGIPGVAAPTGDPLAGVPGVRAVTPDVKSMGDLTAAPVARPPAPAPKGPGPNPNAAANNPGMGFGQFVQNAKQTLSGGATPTKGAAPGLANFLTDAMSGMKGAPGDAGRFASGFSTAAEAGKDRATKAKETAREDEKFAMEKGKYEREGTAAIDAHNKSVAELANITDPSRAPEMRLKLEGMANDFRKALTANDPTMTGADLENAVKGYMDRLQQSVLGFRQQNGIASPPPLPQGPVQGPANLPPPAQVPNLAPGKGVKTPDGKIWQPQGDGWVEVPTS